MQVSIDDQIFVRQRRGGISRYFVELINAFRSHPDFNVTVDLPWRWSRNEHALEHRLSRSLPSPLSRMRLLRLLNAPVQRAAPAADIVHSTYYAAGRQPGRDDTLHVVTVHDMIPELFPELFPAGNPHLSKRSYITQADLVLCVSACTQRDLAAVYGPVRGQIALTPLGVGSSFRPGRRALAGWPSRYVLYVGQRGGYKDFGVLLRAFSRFGDEMSQLHLVAVGGGTWTADEIEALQELGVADRVMRVDAREQDLPAAYEHAAAFVFPSRYEGFGLPTLEAMASGTPTVLSDAPALFEVGGEAAAYFPVGDAAALAEVLSDVILDERRRRCMREQGLAHAGRFSWIRTAARTAAAYESLLKSVR